MASLTQWTRIFLNSGRSWRTREPGMLQFKGLQRVTQDWGTEQQQQIHFQKELESQWHERGRAEKKRETPREKAAWKGTHHGSQLPVLCPRGDSGDPVRPQALSSPNTPFGMKAHNILTSSHLREKTNKRACASHHLCWLPCLSSRSSGRKKLSTADILRRNFNLSSDRTFITNL